MKYLFLLVIFLSPLPAFATDKPFGAWLEEFRAEAQAQGVSKATLDAALEGMEPDDRVITLDRKQPEDTVTLARYLTNTITAKRIAEGRERLDDNRALLEKVSKTFGVPPRFIVALWGIETNFGDYTGGFSTIDALATLAYDGRRSDFFRGELIKALLLVQQEKMQPSDLQGSWAGAMGQCQFMPSTYLNYAVDFDNDGKRDIWNDNADAFASIANYLNALGWKTQESWGQKAVLPEGFDRTQADISHKKSRDEWEKLGVTVDNSDDLPDQSALIMVGDGDDAQAYLVGDNFMALLKWNRSRYFATAVGTLADAIGP